MARVNFNEKLYFKSFFFLLTNSVLLKQKNQQSYVREFSATFECFIISYHRDKLTIIPDDNKPNYFQCLNQLE